MRQGYVQIAVVALEPGSDARGPGARVTVNLCGSLEHEPPCPLAAHHTAVELVDDLAQLRILFATEPDDEADVRRRIAEDLAVGLVDGPDGGASRWTLVSTGPGEIEPGEAA